MTKGRDFLLIASQIGKTERAGGGRLPYGEMSRGSPEAAGDRRPGCSSRCDEGAGMAASAAEPRPGMMVTPRALPHKSGQKRWTLPRRLCWRPSSTHGKASLISSAEIEKLRVARKRVEDVIERADMG